MRVERRHDTAGNAWIYATDPAPHFPFVALTHLLFRHFHAKEVVRFTRLPDEAFMILAFADGLVVRLSHHKDGGTTLRPRDSTASAQFERFANELERTKLPTRWTPMHLDTLELGQDLPGMPAPSPWAWLKGLWTWIRVV